MWYRLFDRKYLKTYSVYGCVPYYLGCCYRQERNAECDLSKVVFMTVTLVVSLGPFIRRDGLQSLVLLALIDAAITKVNTVQYQLPLSTPKV